jgi:hypothetical protein
MPTNETRVTVALEQSEPETEGVAGDGAHLGDALVGLSVAARAAPSRIGAAAVSRRQEVAREPAPPPDLEELGQVLPVDRHRDEGRREQAEAAELVREADGVTLLESVVEGAVPRVQQHQHVDGAEVQDDYGGEEAERDPALFRAPVRQQELSRRPHKRAALGGPRVGVHLPVAWTVQPLARREKGTGGLEPRNVGLGPACHARSGITSRASASSCSR